MLNLKKYINEADYFIEKNSHRYRICEKKHFTPQMQAFLDNPDKFIAKTSGPVFKNVPGEKTTIAVVYIDGQAYIVKRYNLKSFSHAFKVGLRGTCALRAWYYAHYLSHLNIPTIKPIAFLEKRYQFIHAQAYLIAEYHGGVQASRYFYEEFNSAHNWQLVAKEIAAIIFALKNAKLSHFDLHVGNILVMDDKPYLIDLDHMRQLHIGSYFKVRHKKDLNLFFSYLESNKTVKDFFEKLLQK